MNERIRELAEQAGLEFDDDLSLEPEPIYYTTQKDLKKFAELIIKDCVDTLEFHGFEDAVPYIKWMATNKLGAE
jgi:hypothetical protein